MDQAKKFNRKLNQSEVEYGLITISEYREYLPPPGESVTVLDEKDRKYTTKMHSEQPRIDGLTSWYRNHPSVKQGDIVTGIIESQNILRLIPYDTDLNNESPKPKSIEELFDCIQSALTSVNKSINEAISSKNYDKAELFSKLGKELLEFQSCLGNFRESIRKKE